MMGLGVGIGRAGRCGRTEVGGLPLCTSYSLHMIVFCARIEILVLRDTRGEPSLDMIPEQCVQRLQTRRPPLADTLCRMYGDGRYYVVRFKVFEGEDRT